MLAPMTHLPITLLPMTHSSPLLHWEDFPVGHQIDTAGMAIDRDAILAFARQFDPQPFHIDEAAAHESLFGGLCASGWHTCAVAMRLMCDAYLLRSASLGSPGIDSLRWHLPVFPGDTLQLHMDVLAARPMASKPHVGLVQSRWTLRNQRDQTVLTMEGWGMFRRRAARASAAE